MPSYAALIVPAICAGISTDEVNAACDVIDAEEFGWQLTNANGDLESFNELVQQVAEAAGPRIVAMMLPAQEGLDARIGLVKSLSDQQVAFFQALQYRIQTTLNANPASEAARRAAALSSSQDYVTLTQQAAAEARQAAAGAVNYLQREPRTDRVRFNCLTACKQLIQIYRTGTGFD